MRIYINDKDYSKERSDVKRSITQAMHALVSRIDAYKKSGVVFDRIFNDDKVKYDKHGDFYTFKFKSPQNHQVRVLYAHLVVDGEEVILMVGYYIKQRPSKEYIKIFDKFNDVSPLTCYEGAVPLDEAS
ncbi:MAG: hypothetical protein MJ166_08920 [Clostridia bacterium]|nr:hypothetical protein [Clostridia bacterium]